MIPVLYVCAWRDSEKEEQARSDKQKNNKSKSQNEQIRLKKRVVWGEPKSS